MFHDYLFLYFSLYVSVCLGLALLFCSKTAMVYNLRTSGSPLEYDFHALDHIAGPSKKRFKHEESRKCDSQKNRQKNTSIMPTSGKAPRAKKMNNSSIILLQPYFLYPKLTKLAMKVEQNKAKRLWTNGINAMNKVHIFISYFFVWLDLYSYSFIYPLYLSRSRPLL